MHLTELLRLLTSDRNASSTSDRCTSLTVDHLTVTHLTAANLAVAHLTVEHLTVERLAVAHLVSVKNSRRVVCVRRSTIPLYADNRPPRPRGRKSEVRTSWGKTRGTRRNTVQDDACTHRTDDESSPSSLGDLQ